MRPAALVVLVLVAACARQPAAAPSTVPAPPPAQRPVPVPPPAAPADHEKHASDWKPPLSADEDKALDHYAAFSDDGYAFAIAEVSVGAGLTVVTFYAVPGNSVEKRLVLDAPPARTKAAEELSADGFPKPGTPQKVPPGLLVKVDGDNVQLTVAGHPAVKPFMPFPPGKLAKADLLAVSSDGKTAAVRVIANNSAGEFGPMNEIRFLKLFE